MELCSKQHVQQIANVIKQIREGLRGLRGKHRILMSNSALLQLVAFWRSPDRILEIREITCVSMADTHEKKWNLMNFTEVEVILNSLNLHDNLLLFLLKNP